MEWMLESVKLQQSRRNIKAIDNVLNIFDDFNESPTCAKIIVRGHLRASSLLQLRDKVIYINIC